MVKSIFSIRDTKLSTFHLPFFQDSAIQAVRQVKIGMMTTPDMLLTRFPSDYELFELGTFEDVTGSIELYDQKKFITTILALAEEIQREQIWREVITQQTRDDAEIAQEQRKKNMKEKK